MIEVTVFKPRIASVLWLISVLGMIGCAQSGLPPAAVKSPEPTLRALLAEMALLAAGTDGIEVQPLPDPELEDLLSDAEQAIVIRDLSTADQLLEQALVLRPDHPEVLQRRAEVALAKHALDQAETLAIASWERGPKLGPLCRRNWAAIRLAREVRGSVQAADVARQQGEQCTVAAPVRM